MSTTTNLKLFKHDNPSSNTNLFDVEKALNENWDKIDEDIGKKIYYYDNVQEMKNDEGLKEGMVCKTLGYYEANDGGSGLYQVIAAPLASVDEGSYIALSNNLIAKLVIVDGINIKQYGAKGDGITDDSETFQRAIEYLTNLNLNAMSNVNVIYLDSSVYLIEEQIVLPNFLKMVSLGNAIFISKVEQKATFLLTSSHLDNLSAIYPISKFKGKWINGDVGGISIIFAGENKEGSIAIQIGMESNNGGLQYFNAWQMFSNIYINNFETGIYLYMKDCYLNSFDNLLFTSCDKSVVFDNQSSNAGESIKFNNCTFGDGDIGIEINSSALEAVFNECSFDFMHQGIVCKASGCIVKLGYNHFEGIGYTNQLIEKGDNPCILYVTGDVYRDCQCFVNNCDAMNFRGYLFKASALDNLKLHLESLTTKSITDFNKVPGIANDNVRIVINKFYPSLYGQSIVQNKLNAKINNKFQNVAVQSISDNQTIDGYTFSTGVTGKASITEDKILDNSGKSLKIVVPTGGLYTTVKSEEINCVPGQILINSLKWFYENATGHAMRFNSYTTFYDKDGNTISNSTTSTNQADENFSNSRCEAWSRPKQLEFKIVPPRAVKYVVTYVINPTKAGNLYVTDFYSCVY